MYRQKQYTVFHTTLYYQTQCTVLYTTVHCVIYYSALYKETDMKRTQICLTIKESADTFIRKVAEVNDISRSQATELLSDIVQDYFSNEQIKMEHEVRGVFDGRRKK